MVKQNAKKLGLKWEARVDVEMYGDLFHRRLLGEKLYLNKGMEQSFLSAPKTPKEKKIASEIEEWHRLEIVRLDDEVQKQSARLFKAKTVLNSEKPTKKAAEEERIASIKIKKAKRDREKHLDPHDVSESDFRIFPLHYFSMLTVDEKGKKIIIPARYLMRPCYGNESFDRKFSGSYNARFENLGSGYWKSSLESGRRGIMLVDKFFENVSTKEYLKNFKLRGAVKDQKNQVICFEPKGSDYIVIPTVWDVWKKKGQPDLYSAALITDDPLPEVKATGHDRTPIFLKESSVENWLNSNGKLPELREILEEREFPKYSHIVISVA